MNISKTGMNKGKIRTIRLSAQNMGATLEKHLRAKKDEHIRLILICDGAAPKTADISIILEGKRSAASVVWLWRGTGNMRTDIAISIIHAAPETASSLHFKASCEGTSRVNLRALARVQKNARDATTCVNTHALMLSPAAIAFLEPDLEVETDDAHARHGASVGKPSDAELFYLKSRGLSEKEILPLLQEAFFHDIIALT